MTEGTGMSAAEGVDAITALMGEIVEATGDGDLNRLDALIDQMQAIMARTGVAIPGMTDKIAALKDQTRLAKTHFANTDAALWAGDLHRAEQLSIAGPELDFAALNQVAPMEGPFEEDPEDDEDLAFDLSDFAASLGLDLETGDMEDIQDDYADLAARVPGAIEALIDSGADLNKPSGPSRHTALLAALDAPSRSAASIERLIAAGADPLVIHAEGDNAVSWAMGYHHPETINEASEAAVIASLVAHGADVNHKIEGQMTALQRAMLQAGAPQVAALLSHGADHSVDMEPDFHPELLASATSVMVAAAKPEVLRVLLDFGADATRADALGRTPIEFVRTEAEAARARVDVDDEWTVDHAEALEISLGILERHLGAQP